MHHIPVRPPLSFASGRHSLAGGEAGGLPRQGPVLLFALVEPVVGHEHAHSSLSCQLVATTWAWRCPRRQVGRAAEQATGAAEQEQERRRVTVDGEA